MCRCKAPVAGIAMGLISDEVDGETRYVALTDILGAEDAFGDMDFKVAGTRDFVTALQLDTKLAGIPADVLAGALTQAQDARHTLLDVMAEAIDVPDEMSPFAPRIISDQDPGRQDRRGDRPQGQDDQPDPGRHRRRHLDRGRRHHLHRCRRRRVGRRRPVDDQRDRQPDHAGAWRALPRHRRQDDGFGAFVSLLPGKDGLLHVSKLRALDGGQRVENVEDVVSVGQKIQVEISDIDDRGKLSLIPVVDEKVGAES